MTPVFLAQICNNDYLVNNTQALTDISRDCTTINGSVYINPNFSGPFVLLRVKNITDFLGVARFIGWDDPHIETLELPDLEYINTLVFGNLTAPKIYAPKLETAYSLWVNQDGIGTEALFLELRTATEVDVRGNQSRIDLHSLQTVEAGLFVSRLTTRYDELGLEESVETTTSLSLTPSSLRSAGELSLEGRIPRFVSLRSGSPELNVIALPEFETAGDIGDIHIDVHDVPAAISMPSLDRLDGSGAKNGNAPAYVFCNSPFREDSGLSTRDKVAIGVVVGVVGLGVIAGAVFWWRMEEKTATQHKVIQDEIDLPAYSPADPNAAHGEGTGTAGATDNADVPPAYAAR
ncbi:uncharacterized protein BDV14DRAFT_198480 [Aspergillus stella-maris]|uniref:uncharacterized protein n=1 Tax=Aspergillus stella-maris TaxID=1810926 RepID=UPI003CCCF820